jgi:hypothetical protein
MALFQLWNHHRFRESFHVNREDVMKISKIGSKSTYHRCVKDLNNYNYLIYEPSHNPFKGSKINMLIFGTSSGQVVDLGVPNQGQAVVRSNKHKQINQNIHKLPQPKNLMEALDFFKKEKWPTLEAEKFYNHYQSIGWKIGGKIKIENWHACAKNWMLKAAELKQEKQLSQNKDNSSYPLLGELKEAGNLHTTRNKNYNEPL